MSEIRDDVFIVWYYNIGEVKEFLQDINAIDDNIKFTLEIENEKTLPFLDVELTRNGGKLDRNVYRKLNKSNHTIPYDSASPFGFKIAAYGFVLNEPLKYAQTLF